MQRHVAQRDAGPIRFSSVGKIDSLNPYLTTSDPIYQMQRHVARGDVVKSIQEILVSLFFQFN